MEIPLHIKESHRIARDGSKTFLLLWYCKKKSQNEKLLSRKSVLQFRQLYSMIYYSTLPIIIIYDKTDMIVVTIQENQDSFIKQILSLTIWVSKLTIWHANRQKCKKPHNRFLYQKFCQFNFPRFTLFTIFFAWHNCFENRKF